MVSVMFFLKKVNFFEFWNGCFKVPPNYSKLLSKLMSTSKISCTASI